jgi:hypothetical protein
LRWYVRWEPGWKHRWNALQGQLGQRQDTRISRWQWCQVRWCSIWRHGNDVDDSANGRATCKNL